MEAWADRHERLLAGALEVEDTPKLPGADTPALEATWRSRRGSLVQIVVPLDVGESLESWSSRHERALRAFETFHPLVPEEVL